VSAAAGSSPLPFPFTLSGNLLRILSDVHFGDHASRVSRLPQLAPLLDGVNHLVLNGDTMDTRPGPHPAHTAACRREIGAYFSSRVPRVTCLTGNHDADFSSEHWLDLAGGRIFVIHGDVVFDDLVPWSQDAPFIARRLTEEFQRLPPDHAGRLAERCAVFRRVALAIPQRHQSERNRLKYAAHFLADTVWPPLRLLRVFRAWREAPQRAAAFSRLHRPAARFMIKGHTHRPGIWTMPDGLTVINTGSFCRPLGGLCVDLAADTLVVRSIVARGGEFRPGGAIATFGLAAG